MEAAVANISDPEEGYKALFNKIQEMRKITDIPQTAVIRPQFFYG
jgi:hypothetical protein